MAIKIINKEGNNDDNNNQQNFIHLFFIIPFLSVVDNFLTIFR